MQNINSVPSVPMVNMEPKKAEVEQKQVSFQGTPHQAAPAEEKKAHPVLKLITAAVVAVIAGASHKTYSVNKALKEASLKDSSKIKLSDIFVRNLNPINWFSKADATKALTDIECTKVGDSGKLFKTKDGDTVLLDRSKVFKLKDGESEEVEAFAKKAKPADATSQTTRQATHNINPQLIKDIKELPQEVTPENTQRLTNLILKDMGFNPEELGLVARKAKAEELLGGEARFDMKTGELLLNEENFHPDSQVSINDIAPIIRHELDHFEKMAKTYKQMGSQKYKQFLDSFSILPKDKINNGFWSRAAKDINIEGFDHTPYTQGLKSQDAISPYVTSQYHQAQILSTYINNPFEQTAHQVQHSFESALDVEPLIITYEPVAEQLAKIDTTLDKVIKKANLPSNSKSVLYDYFFQEEAKKGAINGDDAVTIQANVMKNMIPSIESTPITPEISHAAYKNIIESQTKALKIQAISDEAKAAILKALDKNLDDYLSQTNILSPEKELELLAHKIHVANGGQLNTRDIGENFEQTITIPPQIKKRIFQNSEFQSSVNKEANADFEPLEKTQSYILRSLLWKTTTF